MTQRLHLYRELARYYDALNPRKDYGKEVLILERIARRYGRSGGSSWLDVACGTGKHLEQLRRRHECAGVDSSREMLRIARRRLPGVRLRRADMRTFRLGRQFDAVSCLFSAIGHLTTERDLLRTFARLRDHLKPGGVAIVEPWIHPSQAKPGSVHLRTYEDASATVVRLAYSKVQGPLTVIRYSYLIGIPGHGVRHLEETDRGLMVTPARLKELMRTVGLSARFLFRGSPSGRGLLVGVRPRRPGKRDRRPP